MTATDQDLRAALDHLVQAGDLDLVPPGLPEAAEGDRAAPGPGGRARWLAAAAVLVALTALVTVLALRPDDDGSTVRTTAPATEVRRPGGWTPADDSPLVDVSNPITAWTGEELLAFGGYLAPCPPNLDCMGPQTTSTQGAALDPITGNWRPIADLPIPFTNASTVAVDGTVYVWGTRAGDPAGGATKQGTLLAYDVDQDRWSELPKPFDGGARYQLVDGGDALILNPSSDEGGTQPVRRFDLATETWDVLPDDPLPRLFDRSLTEIDGVLYLFGKHIVPAGSLGREPAFGARLDLATMRWEELPATGVVGDAAIVAVGDTIISTPPGSSREEPRPQPAGRRFDPETGTWSDLPDVPDEDPAGSATGPPRAAGYATRSAFLVSPQGGLVLDLDDGTWTWVDRPPTFAGETERVVADAGGEPVALGGADWGAGDRPEARRDVWIWRPPD